MSQNFDPTAPQTGSAMDADSIRTNLLALYTCHSGTSAPISPSIGQLWYDTTNNVLKQWNGTSWQEVSFVDGVGIKNNFTSVKALFLEGFEDNSNSIPTSFERLGTVTALTYSAAEGAEVNLSGLSRQFDFDTNAYIYKLLYTKPGHQVTLSYYAKAVVGNTATVKIGDNITFPSVTDYIDDTDWTFGALSFTPGVTSAYTKIAFDSMVPGSTVYFDAIQVYEGDLKPSFAELSRDAERDYLSIIPRPFTKVWGQWQASTSSGTGISPAGCISGCDNCGTATGVVSRTVNDADGKCTEFTIKTSPATGNYIGIKNSVFYATQPGWNPKITIKFKITSDLAKDWLFWCCLTDTEIYDDSDPSDHNVIALRANHLPNAGGGDTNFQGYTANGITSTSLDLGTVIDGEAHTIEMAILDSLVSMSLDGNPHATFTTPLPATTQFLGVYLAITTLETVAVSESFLFYNAFIEQDK